MQRFVDRDRAARRQRHALGADRLVLVGKLHLAEENIGLVLPTQLVGLIQIFLHPLPDLLHRHLILGDDVALDQDAADRRIGIAIMGIVIDADGRTVVEADPRRTLDLREQQVGLFLQPADFEPAAFNRAILDFGAIVIGYQLAAADLAEYLALVG